MKLRAFIIGLMTIAQSIAYAGNPAEKEVPSAIKDVTVFLHGAQVNRSGETSLTAGTTTLRFSGLSPALLPNSIQVKAGSANVTILSVIHQMDYTKEQAKSEEIADLELKRLDWQAKIDRVNTALGVIAAELELLNLNRSFAGQANGLKVDELRAAADFFRVRLTELSDKGQELTTQLGKHQTELNKIDQQLNVLRSRRETATSQVLVNVNVKNAVKTDFYLSYTVNEASWTPAYDLRVESISKPVALTYKANVTQLSGEDWKDVNLTLSTGNPYESGSKPYLDIWRLGFYQPYYANPYAGEGLDIMYRNAAAPVAEAYKLAEDKSEDVEQNLAIPVTTNIGVTSVDFEIEIPYTVLTDGKNYAVDVKEHSLPAQYEYYCAPKLDLSAFLTAKITNWEGFNLLSGQANIYFEGTYLGQSYLDVTTKDTLELSLGRDKNIVVTREKKTDFTKKQILGGNKRETRTFEISVRNKKQQAINIVIEDQMPVPVNNDIKLEDPNKAEGMYNTETGKLTWRLNLPPSQEKKWTFGYTVKYPKDKTVVLE